MACRVPCTGSEAEWSAFRVIQYKLKHSWDLGLLSNHAVVLDNVIYSLTWHDFYIYGGDVFTNLIDPFEVKFRNVCWNHATPDFKFLDPSQVYILFKLGDILHICNNFCCYLICMHVYFMCEYIVALTCSKLLLTYLLTYLLIY